MGMTPDEFFACIVQDNWVDYHADRCSVRRAFNAAVSASQLADHWLAFNKRHAPSLVQQFESIGQYVEFLCGQTNGSFRDIRSLANAYKHLYTDVTSKYGAHSTIDSPGAMTSVEFTKSELIKLEVDSSDCNAVLMYTRRDGSSAAFGPALDTVVSYWEDVVYGT